MNKLWTPTKTKIRDGIADSSLIIVLNMQTSSRRYSKKNFWSFAETRLSVYGMNWIVNIATFLWRSKSNRCSEMLAWLQFSLPLFELYVTFLVLRLFLFVWAVSCRMKKILEFLYYISAWWRRVSVQAILSWNWDCTYWHQRWCDDKLSGFNLSLSR